MYTRTSFSTPAKYVGQDEARFYRVPTHTHTHTHTHSIIRYKYMYLH